MGEVLMKGQMFIIAAIFMILGFILLRGLISLPALTQEKAFQDVSYLDKNLKNIKTEYSQVAGAGSVQALPNKTGIAYLVNFTEFVRGQFDSKILFVYIFSNGTTQNVSITIGNFLQNYINGSINLTNATLPGRTFELEDKKNVTLEFNTSSVWINITLNYTIQNRETIERLYFNSSTKHYILAFFDVTLQDTGFFVRSKSIYNRTW